MAHAVQKLTEATEVLFKSPKQGFKAIVCGGRDYSNKKRVFAALDKVHAKTPIRLLIQGGAKGADLFAKKWAVSRDISHIEMRANWDAFGKAAGHKRNAEMLNYLLSVAGEKNSKPDCGVIAFDGGFHGRTLAAVNLNGKVAAYKTQLGPLPGPVYHIPYPSTDTDVSVAQAQAALERLISVEVDVNEVAAIIAELDKQFPGVPELGDDIEQFMEVARAEHWITLA